MDDVPEKLLPVLRQMIPFPSHGLRPKDFAHLVQTIIENPMINGEVIRLDGAARLSL